MSNLNYPLARDSGSATSGRTSSSSRLLAATQGYAALVSRPRFAACGVLIAAAGLCAAPAAALAAPTANIGPDILKVDEGAGSAELTVTLSAKPTKDVTVTYEAREAKVNAQATAGKDFQAGSGTLRIPAGTKSGTIAVKIIEDTLVEDQYAKERFKVLLTSASGAVLGTAVAKVDILDNDSGGPAPGGSDTSGNVDAGPYAYLDDVDKAVKPAITSSAPLTRLPFPRIALGDSPTSQSDDKLAKYHVVSTHNLDKLAKAQKIEPDLVALRQMTPSAYQASVSTGLPFKGTGKATEGTDIYAGHWLYQAGTRLSSGIGPGDSVIKVDDASRFTPSTYAVIYDSPPGSFKNAEHVFIKAVDKAGDKLTLGQRGYKSNAVSHGASSVVAAHETGSGQKAPQENWLYNQSTACPTDANGKTLGDVMVAFMKKDLGSVTGVRADGIHFDTDRYFMSDAAKADVDNDLVADGGIAPNGYNLWGEGLEGFYDALRRALPDKLIVGGGTGSRGMETLNGVQWEGFPVSGDSFAVKPDYSNADSELANYGLHVRTHTLGPALTEALNKSPTKLYPNLEPSHRNVSGDKPTSNAPFRFSFGLALLDDGFYGQPSSGDHNDVWWDEYAVDVVPGSRTFGHAIDTDPNDESLLRAHRGWMGLPLGERVRLYDKTDFAPDKSMVANGGFDANLNGWSGKNLGISQDADSLEGTRSLRASRPSKYAETPSDASVLGPKVSLQKGVEYTLVFSAKASSVRQVNVGVGGFTSSFVVPTQWVRRVMTFTASSTGSANIKFLLGRDHSEVWIDAVYLFKGNASVFQRDFENARVVVNATPKSRTVDLGGTFLRIKGTGQDAVNDGSKVTSVTLPPYDAAIVVRQ